MLRFVAGLALLAWAPAAETPAETARRIQQQEAALPGLRTGGDRALLAQALIETGQAALAAGDYNRALDRASEAAKLFRGLKDPAREAGALNTAGSARLLRGQYQAALEVFGEALALDRQQGDAMDEAKCLGNIGNAYFYQGKYLDALESYQAALSGIDAAASEPWAAGRRPIALTNLALLHEQLGQDERALDYYLKTLASSVISPAERGQVLSNVGAVYRRLGNPEKALETYDAARKLSAREHLPGAEIHALQSDGLTRLLDLGDTARGKRSFNEALRLADGAAVPREIALAHLFRGESSYRAGDVAAAGLDFERALSAARSAGDPAEQWTALYGIARAARRRGDRTAALARLREAIAILETARSALSGASLHSGFLPDQRDVYDEAIGLLLEAPARDAAQLFRWFEQAGTSNRRDTVRGVTAPPALAAVRQRLPEGSALVEYWIGDGRIAAAWITRGGTGIVDRAWTEADDAAVRSFATRLRAAQDGSWREGAPPLLHGIPWASIRRVVIVPDGVLYLVPFEVLPLDAGLLIERMPVSYLPSASFLFREMPARSALPPWGGQLAAFGDAVELRAVARALPGRAVLHAGAENLKRRLLNGALDGIPLLHLATPATLDLTDSNRSRIRFTPEAAQGGSEYLFRPEAQALPLESADLVTLSAGDTEAGRVTHGAVIQSFSRAFLAAGARSAVTALWRVEDRATADFMQMFYESLGKGLAKDEALRAAKLRFLRHGGERSLPQAWAAFVLNGDGDSPIRPVLSWLQAILIAGLASALLVLYYRHRRARAAPRPLLE